MVAFESDVNWSRGAWIGFGAVLVLAVLYVAHAFVGTFVFGLFVYYATRRLYRRVRRRVKPPSLAAALSLVVLALPAVTLLYYTLAIALQEFQRFVAAFSVSNGQLSPLLEYLSPYIQVSTLVEDPGSLLGQPGGVEAITESLLATLSYLGVIGNGLLHLFVMFAIAFYLLRDGPRFSRWASHFTDAYGVFDRYFREVDRSLDKVFYGNILNAIITGAIGAIAFSLLNFVAPPALHVPYPALTGLLAGVASLIPIVGMKLVYVPLAGYLAVTAGVDGSGWWFVGLFVLVAFLVVDTIPDLVVRPYVSGGNLHVGTLMFAYVLGPLLWGWYGIFLGPILLVLVVHFVRIVLPELLAGTPIRPYSVDPAAVVGHDRPSAGVVGDDGDAVADGDDPDPTVDDGPDPATVSAKSTAAGASDGDGDSGDGGPSTPNGDATVGPSDDGSAESDR